MRYNIKFTYEYEFDYEFDSAGFHVNRIETLTYENLTEVQFKDTLMLLLKETTSVLEIEVDSL